MEKTSTLTSGINFNNLFPTFAKKKASLMTRLMPSWTPGTTSHSGCLAALPRPKSRLTMAR
jgi:hypothetical protein